jgi:lambda repressor-like predicted transcriptional regulator
MNKIQIIGHIMAATGKQIPEVAKEYGYSKVTLYNAINGYSTSPVLRDLISSIIGIQVADIWPEGKNRKKNTPAPADQNSLVDGSW